MLFILFDDVNFICTIYHILQLEIVQESNKTLSKDTSILAHTCDQLTTELVTCREEIEYWEKKYHNKDEEVYTPSTCIFALSMSISYEC